MANIGDKVKVVTNKTTEEGILMHSPDPNITIIKLDNGYNMGFEKKDVKEIKLIEKKKSSKENSGKSENKIDKNLKTISILHCGGTIASKVDYETGAVKAKFSPEEILRMFPELKGIANIRSKLIANILSENIRFGHYNLIAKDIEREVKAGTQGIIITHGTDTLHYTAAALSFILENLNVPVLLVGAQRSSDRGSSDAFLNLKCAVNFIVNSDFADVAICMHAQSDDQRCAILPGVKARKLHSSRRDAFKAVNAREFAFVDNGGKINWTRKDYKKISDKKEKLNLKLFDENVKVGLLKIHPHMYTEEFTAYKDFDGLILEGTGLGHIPLERMDDLTIENENILAEVQKLAKKMPVTMTVQTIFGPINMNVYSPGRKLVESGVMGNGLDITAETAFIKLSWLLGNYKDLNEVRKLFAQNLRGEISLQRNYEKEFL